jgi:hypothetical protein
MFELTTGYHTLLVGVYTGRSVHYRTRVRPIINGGDFLLIFPNQNLR